MSRYVDLSEKVTATYYDEQFEKWDHRTVTVEDVLNEVCDDYTVMSFTQTEQRWIPCSERLPEDKQPVLFSTKTGRVHQGKYYNDCSMNQWYSALDKMRAFNNVVNAWMPLPEPYVGRRQE